MLFNLSRKNFKKSIRDYSVYFFTLILGVAVFYIFNAIETQTAMMEVTKAKAEIIDMMNSALEAVSIFVSFILGYLIVYASRFMLKKRKKEFAVYLTLGMKKTQISGMLWIETVFMGIISLGAGLLVGIGLSQFMSLFVSKIFEAGFIKICFYRVRKSDCEIRVLFSGDLYCRDDFKYMGNQPCKINPLSDCREEKREEHLEKSNSQRFSFYSGMGDFRMCLP